jgi:hypothetical protein
MIRFHKRYLKQRIEQMAGTRKQQHGVIEAKSDVGDSCIGQHIKALIISCYFVHVKRRFVFLLTRTCVRILVCYILSEVRHVHTAMRLR